MTAYIWVKFVHVISATLLFGTGIGTAFFMLKAYLSDSETAMVETSKHVVLADWLFTTPAVVVQLVTGVWLMWILDVPFASSWFVSVIGLFALVGACWIPVVWIQVRVRNMVASGSKKTEYKSLMRTWIALGIPAFTGVLVLFYLMISKHGMYG
ncbi:MAG: DUF2269 domain-containing protein [Woeseiaceae bacterium]|nr:DUF2269 domain-containing protein [Woeseiaceae bacterium]